MTICLFPDLKIITTFAILKMDEKSPNSKAWLKQKDKIGARISPPIRKKKEEILSYSDMLLIFNELIGALSCWAISFFFFGKKSFENHSYQVSYLLQPFEKIKLQKCEGPVKELNCPAASSPLLPLT